MLEVAGLLVVSLLSAPEGRSSELPAVLVFDVQESEAGLDAAARERLSTYLHAKLSSLGRFRVVPRSEVTRRLQDEKRESYRPCYDDACQIELGKAVAAQKIVQTVLVRGQRRCILTSTLFDLRTELSEDAAVASGSCSTDGLLALVDELGLQLGGAASPARSNSAVRSDARRARPSKRVREDCSLEPELCYQAVLAIERVPPPQGRTEARARLEIVCQTKHKGACTRLAGYLLEGLGGASEPERAAVLFAASCKDKDPEACTQLGELHERGQGVTKDLTRAARLYEPACQRNHAEACARLGLAYQRGTGVPVDRAQSAFFLERACRLGHSVSCGAGVRAPSPSR